MTATLLGPAYVARSKAWRTRVLIVCQSGGRKHGPAPWATSSGAGLIRKATAGLGPSPRPRVLGPGPLRRQQRSTRSARPLSSPAWARSARPPASATGSTTARNSRSSMIWVSRSRRTPSDGGLLDHRGSGYQAGDEIVLIASPANRCSSLAIIAVATWARP